MRVNSEEKAAGITLISEKRKLFRLFPVPRETKNKLEQYVELLFECNRSINLVSESSLPHIWTRHIMDSAQLLPLLPKHASSLADLGSGAGFPGMVLAILGVQGVHLIESIGKKAEFLRNAAEKLKVEVMIHRERIEKIRGLKTDIVTARALKPLPQLLTLAEPFMNSYSICLFLKGRSVEEELTEARKYWTFSCDRIPSLSDSSGAILKISHLKRLKSHGVRLSVRKKAD